MLLACVYGFGPPLGCSTGRLDLLYTKLECQLDLVLAYHPLGVGCKPLQIRGVFLLGLGHLVFDYFQFGAYVVQ